MDLVPLACEDVNNKTKTKHITSTKKGITISNETTTIEPSPKNGQQPYPLGGGAEVHFTGTKPSP